MEEAGQLLMNYLARLPIIVAGLVGIILAIALWRRNATASVLVLIGCAVALLMSAVSPVIHHLITRRVVRGEMNPADIVAVFWIAGLIHTLAFAGVLGLLIAAAFVGRRRPGLWPQ